MSSSDDKIARAIFAMLGCAIFAGAAIVFVIATVWKAWH